MGNKVIRVSEEVYNELIKIKKELQVKNMDLVLRYILRLPPFHILKEHERK